MLSNIEIVYKNLFKKTYDGIEWSFILAMLQALGFDLAFINSVETLFVDASTCLATN